MILKLKVTDGSNAGKEIIINKDKFLIGRADECGLRPHSDAISRRHCVIIKTDKVVGVRDLKSRNGTIVNGEKIVDTVHLNAGDIVDIGPMRLELETATPTKRVGSIAPHVADGAQVSDSIMDWLKQDSQSSMSETKLSLPSLSALDTPEKKFTDVAEEGADIIQRHLDSLKAKESQSESDTV